MPLSPYIHNAAMTIQPRNWIKIIRPDGTVLRAKIIDFGNTNAEVLNNGVANNNNIIAGGGGYTDTFTLATDRFDMHSGQKTTLSWYNCYSFGNGVESNRINDVFNKQFLTPGAKVSTIYDSYEEERRKYGLIYSGLYNSTSGVNNLNQFIQAEKITKDINPVYGSIQKLHTRDTDLITICEDKVLKIMANKDALYNADGNMQLTATENVLGQTVPFVGEYGISKNPESFVSEAYRSYFTDKQRGAVMRLSRDGLTPISDHGMKDWFRDNLKTTNTLVGSYDDRNDEYNLTLKNRENNQEPTTVTFKEDVKGWVSFKSFVPENGISCANNYFTIKDGKIWKHYIDANLRNTFYNEYINSSLNVILNDQPGTIKSFHTLDYEGSQSRVEGINNFVIKDTTNVVDVGQSSDRYGYFDLTAFESTMKPNTWNIAGSYSLNEAVIIPIKQYRNNILIFSGNIKAWNLDNANSSVSMSWGHLRKEPYSKSSPGDWEVGDIITTEEQENSIHAIGSDLFNSTPTDGWYVSQLATDKDIGSLPEFIEKEGKWFNYIKGVDSVISQSTNFGDFDIQGIGIIVSTSSTHASGIVHLNPDNHVAGEPWYNLWVPTYANQDTVTWSLGNLTAISGSIFDIVRPYTYSFYSGGKYKLILEVSQYEGSGFVKVTQGGISNDAKLNASGYYEEIFIADTTILPKLEVESGVIKAVIKVNIIETRKSLTFGNMNSSLQVGDTLYYETPSERLGVEQFDNGEFNASESPSSFEKFPSLNLPNVPFVWDSGKISITSALISQPHLSVYHPDMLFQSINTAPKIIKDNKTYRVSFEISDYSAGRLRVVLSGTNYYGTVSFPETVDGDGIYTHDISIRRNVVEENWLPPMHVSSTESYPHIRFEAYDSPFTGKIDNISVREIFIEDMLGFTRLEVDKIEKIGVVNSINNNTITILEPQTTSFEIGDYVFFTKNRIVNKASLKGYYADIKLENNSSLRAEIFALSSEITESSK